MKENHMTSFDQLTSKEIFAAETRNKRRTASRTSKSSQSNGFRKRVWIPTALFGAVVIGTVIDSANKLPVYTPDPYPVQSVTRVENQPVVSKWNDPNVKPFDVSPFYQGGYTETVYWDSSTNQWYCKVSKHSATPCKNADGLTEEQLAERSLKAENYMADRDARERALNDYWCGPFEDPKKTGCKEL